MQKNTNLSKETIEFLKTRRCYTENLTAVESIEGLISGIKSDRAALGIRIKIIDVGIHYESGTADDNDIESIKQQSVYIQSIFTNIIHRIKIIYFLKGLKNKEKKLQEIDF